MKTIPPKITLRAARVNAGLPQKEAAKQLGISQATLQNYENGATVPSWDVVEQIETLYNYPANFIFFGSNSRLKRELNRAEQAN